MKQTDRVILLFSRVLIASLFIVAGVRKLLAWKAMLGYFGALGLPMPELVLPLTVLLEIGGGLALISGWRLREVCVVMACFTFLTALSAHQFWNAEGPKYDNQLYNFLKNVALVGSFAVLFVQARSTSNDGAALYARPIADG
ncbi:DoxX family protein [Paraburkholderia sp. D15]|uniref:DoxX family protein n=1 Tax=Paraburkholderia sp. D15 TaxID=2880218 RepID=UPI00247B071D|nr:DoxX family protein [Paraburkholderia sp. D15]WGS53283.1 DoxX family protein [Paraburkholderia sp. D15]